MRELSAELHSKEMENAAVAGELNSGVGLKELPQEDVGELMRAKPGGYGKLVSQPWRMGELVRDQPGGWEDLKELTLEDERGL